VRIASPPIPTPFPYTTLFRSHMLDRLIDLVIEGRFLARRCPKRRARGGRGRRALRGDGCRGGHGRLIGERAGHAAGALPRLRGRSEEHTSELQSRVDLVCRLL